MMLRGLAIREAIASTAMSHPNGCECDTCKAHGGDLEAFARIWTEVQRSLDAEGPR